MPAIALTQPCQSKRLDTEEAVVADMVVVVDAGTVTVAVDAGTVTAAVDAGTVTVVDVMAQGIGIVMVSTHIITAATGMRIRGG